MAQGTTEHESQRGEQEQQGANDKNRLGPLLCWAVVFADIGTSIYYVPGILYGTVNKLAGFFVLLTMIVFVLLTLKYAEVTYRFPQGGGVVTVASQALNRWFGALGGMLILVDYFLTSAISSLSGILYLSVVFPIIGTQHALFGLLTPALLITLLVLVLLGVLNWVGISASAKVSLVGAIIAFASDIAILYTVFSHVSFVQFWQLFGTMFSGQQITVVKFLTGFAGAFLAFSGLESISQISPEMKLPRRAVGKLSLLFVIITVGLTSPLITMLSTLLLPQAAGNAVKSAQIVSLLAGHWGNVFLQVEVAISAGALLIFASNTAIIGAYHVFIALARMEFFPQWLLKKNRMRGTPHNAIAIATFIPILVLLLVDGNINVLGDMYAFGLLGAFTLTCLSMDIVRYRQHKTNWQPSPEVGAGQPQEQQQSRQGKQMAAIPMTEEQEKEEEKPEPEGRWTRSWFNFWLGIFTTVLVSTAWCTNLVAKPLATAFGGTLAVIGMGIAYFNYRREKRKGRVPVVATGGHVTLPVAVLAVVTANREENRAIVQASMHDAQQNDIVFLYLGERASMQEPALFQVASRFLDDEQAKEELGVINKQVQDRGINSTFVYRHKERDAVKSIWQRTQPRELICGSQQEQELSNLPPGKLSYEQTSTGTIIHYQRQ